MSTTSPKKIVIVGGVAGGASAAARCRRLSEQSEIIILQKDNDVSFANCGMPYYIGGEITDRSKLTVQTPASLKSRLNLDARVNTSVTRIDTATQTVAARNDQTGESYELSYDELILAVGAAPFKPPVKGIDRPGLLSLRNLQDMDHITEWIDKMLAKVKPADMHCVVAGAGFIGLEMVEQLHRRGFNVTLVEMLPQILAPMDPELAIIMQNDIEKRDVQVITGDPIDEFTPYEQDPDVSIVKLKSGRTLLPAHLTILGLGVRPDTAVIKEAGIECNSRGYVVVNEHLQTSVPHVWAAGDSIEVSNMILGNGEKWAVALAGPANRQGRMIADNIFMPQDKKRTYKGTIGTSVVRVFNTVAACVGLNTKFLCSKNIQHTSVHIHPGSHAGYYPGAAQIHLKLTFDKDSGKIYGAQAVGLDMVEKRIDVIATAIKGGMTVFDLADLELCYAPPLGSAKDPVNFAGMVAQNICEGLVSTIQYSELEKSLQDPNVFLLDVRGVKEIESNGRLSDQAYNIPVDDLRTRLNEVPKDKHIIVSCASGQRAYYACRILLQNGYERVENLSGAYLTFHAIHPEAIHDAVVGEWR